MTLYCFQGEFKRQTFIKLQTQKIPSWMRFVLYASFKEIQLPYLVHTILIMILSFLLFFSCAIFFYYYY